MTLTIILVALAFACFVIAAVGVPSLTRVNLVALGLALWLAADFFRL